MLLLTVLISCGQSTDTPAQVTTSMSVEAETAETLSEEEKLYSSLPDGDFGGAVFNIIQYEEIAPSSGTICVDDLTGESVNDAKYERTQAVREKLNVEINHTNNTLEKVAKDVPAAVAAGDDIYQAVSQITGRTVTEFLMQGYLMDQNEIPEIDFSKPWWNDNAINSLKLNEKTFMSFGDINYYLFDFQSVLMFSKAIQEDYSLSDLYSLVSDGTWTIDAFLDAVKNAARDLNGDGAMGKKDDLLGYTGYPSQSNLGFHHGADAELFSRDPNGKIVYGGVSEKMFDVLSRYSSVIGQKEFAKHDSSWRDIFRKGLTYFCGLGVGELSMMRDLEFDYGIVPFPKYDENQPEYISYVTDQMQPISIPVTVSDTELAGAVLENMAAESYRRVRENYFQNLVESKYLRDNESVEILRMLFAGDIRFEIEGIYGWGKVNEKIWNSIGGKADRFMSDMEAQLPVLESAMAASLEAVS